MKTKQERAAERLEEFRNNAVASPSLEGPQTARELLMDRDFYPMLGADIAKAGLVKERRNALATYLVATSRLREKPLNEILKGASSSGKNHLAKTVLKFLPDGEVMSASSMTARALDYAGSNRLSHKVVYIDELVGVSHPLRQLISEGRLIRLVTTMENGVRVMKEQVTQGPVACITTTTQNALAIDDESRNLSVWIDETYVQTQEILKAYVSVREPLSPKRLALWHNVQHLIADQKDVVINTPPFFVDITTKILPYGDLRMRRYWPAFVEACKIIALIRAAAWPQPGNAVTVSFEDFATALCIFDRLIAYSLTRSGGDLELATADLVDRLSGGLLERSSGRKDLGIVASDLIGQAGIRSLDQAYRALRRARDAGAVYIVNLHDHKNNEKRYARSPESTFLGSPDYVVKKLGLRISGTYVHPITGHRKAYGQ